MQTCRPQKEKCRPGAGRREKSRWCSPFRFYTTIALYHRKTAQNYHLFYSSKPRKPATVKIKSRCHLKAVGSLILTLIQASFSVKACR